MSIGRFLQNRGCAPTVWRFVAVVRGVLVLAAIGLSRLWQGGSRFRRRPSGPRLVFRDAAGRELTTDDLRGASGTMRWEVSAPGRYREGVPAAPTSPRSRWTRRSSSRVELLDQARRLAPNWAYPVYDTAFTYLLQGESAKAEERYAEVDRMRHAGFSPPRPRSTALSRAHRHLFPGFCKAFASPSGWTTRRRSRPCSKGSSRSIRRFLPHGRN